MKLTVIVLATLAVAAGCKHNDKRVQIAPGPDVRKQAQVAEGTAARLRDNAETILQQTQAVRVRLLKSGADELSVATEKPLAKIEGAGTAVAGEAIRLDQVSTSLKDAHAKHADRDKALAGAVQRAETAEAEAEDSRSGTGRWVIWLLSSIGAVLIAAGIAGALVFREKLFAVGAVAGLGICLAAQVLRYLFAWAPWIALGCVLAAGGYAAWLGYRAARSRKTLTEVVASVDKAKAVLGDAGTIAREQFNSALKTAQTLKTRIDVAEIRHEK